MKRALLVVGFLLFPCLAFGAPFLASDLPPAGVVITASEVEVTTLPANTIVVRVGTVVVRGADFLLLDLGGFATGAYRFRARWAGSSGWWSEWTPFLDAAKPVAPAGGVRIVP